MPVQSSVGRFLFVLFLSLSGAMAQAQPAPIAAVEKCKLYHIPDRLQPDWTLSADWLDSDVLAIADTVGGKLLYYTVHGKVRHPDPGPLEKAAKAAGFGPFHPAGLQTASPNSRWIQMFGGRFVKVDKHNALQGALSLDGLKAGDRTIESVYAWTMAEGYLVGFGNLKDAVGSWSTGFFSVNLEDTHEGHVVEELPRYPPERVWYRLGFHYLTSIGDIGYGLTIDEAESRLDLVRIRPRGDSLERLDVQLPALQNLPDLEDFTTPEEYVELMKEVEESTMPTALHGWEGDLYLVWRSSSQTTGQQWFLSKIELPANRISTKNNGKSISTLELPTSANHLMVVPGNKYWALLEKGPVEGFGIQEERVFRLIPSSMIRAFNTSGVICK